MAGAFTLSICLRGRSVMATLIPALTKLPAVSVPGVVVFLFRGCMDVRKQQPAA